VAWLGVLVLLAFAAAVHVHPIKRVVPFLEERDLTDQLYGWKALAARADRELRSLDPGGRVLAPNYQIASELYFYMAGQPRPLCINFFGRGNQYDLWNDFQGFLGGSAILVDDHRASSRFIRHFNSVEELEPFRVVREGRVVKEFRLYRCLGFRMDGPLQDYFKDPLGFGIDKMLARRETKRR
jgi:hypothetical protein